VQANGMISATNLVVRHKFGEGPVIALNAHGDVVPPGEGWTKQPLAAEVIDGWMYGNGVAVSECDFVTYTWSLLALKQAGVPLARSSCISLTMRKPVAISVRAVSCTKGSASPIL
jgi:succinyl-diaminopimelate desuccinylase